MVQERDNSSSEDNEEWLDLVQNWNFEHILEVEPTKYADRLVLTYERKHRIKEEKQ